MGGIYRATRASEEQEEEFLASRDLWFRPIGFEQGPDGALYLVDMQRRVIEHPDYIPAKVRVDATIREGEQPGRIYRIIARDQAWRFPAPLKSRCNEELVRLIAHHHQWIRMAAQRLLIERGARDVAVQLREMVEGSSRLGRWHALWTLHGLNLVSHEDLAIGMEDEAPLIRRATLRILGDRPRYHDPLWRHVLNGATDEALSVRLEALQWLGARTSSQNIKLLLAGFWKNDHRDQWIDLAWLTALVPQTREVLQRCLEDEQITNDSLHQSGTRLAQLLRLHAAKDSTDMG